MSTPSMAGHNEARTTFVSHDIEPHPMAFSGSGGEYFRVWIVNVLLTIVTLGFYTPWARRRTAQYFYGNTLVAGSPLEFTAQQRRMVVGFLILVLITAAYNLAANTGQDLAVGLFILGGAVLSPFIWGSAMRFRLGNTRWRGLRLRFTANWREVYTASWPVFALALVWIVVVFGLQAIAPEVPAGRKFPPVTQSMSALALLGVLLTVLCFIRLEYNYRSLLVLRAHLGDEAGRWKPVYFDFVKVWLATVLVFIVSVVVLAGVCGLLFSSSWMLFASKARGAGMVMMILFFALAIVLGIFLLFLASAPARAYREARMFQLMWDNIGVSHIARFKCSLRTGSYVLLRLKNMLLALLTLGFYRPFAMVSEYRMKLESVTLHVKGGVDQVASQLVHQQREGGIGDALADAAGLDLVG
ncbi:MULTISPECIES: YjgN family protein [unclassified Acidovorax]|uniref:YjgN family protein n=1 Tax=unclassified Acidovorax TaxID=2684926 RepID=UPI002882DE82|nr:MULTISPECIES: YjgN family protein [unclassified Acidovorax]